MLTLRQGYDKAGLRSHGKDRNATTAPARLGRVIASGQSSGSTSGLVTGLFRRLIDLALQDDLLALDAAGLAAAVEEVDVAELPQRIGELASTWVAKALADVHEDDRPPRPNSSPPS